LPSHRSVGCGPAIDRAICGVVALAFLGGSMASETHGETAEATRLRSLALRCRDLSEMTMVPEVSRELLAIAAALDDEAERAERK
jgi:hypothetical protein